MSANWGSSHTARGQFGRARPKGMVLKNLISLILLVAVLLGLFYLMWVISQGYPLELAFLECKSTYM
jgi:hypothetical protein